MALIEIQSNPSRRDLRWFGVILVVFFGLVGAAAHFRFGAPRVAYGLWGMGGALGALYFAVRPLRIPVYLAWMHLFFPLGWTVSHLALALLYYGILTPVAVLMRIVGHDPLKRRWEREHTTYWVEHRTGGDASRYLRQF